VDSARRAGAVVRGALGIDLPAFRAGLG
jgi:hypothetical protein